MLSDLKCKRMRFYIAVGSTVRAFIHGVRGYRLGGLCATVGCVSLRQCQLEKLRRWLRALAIQSVKPAENARHIKKGVLPTLKLEIRPACKRWWLTADRAHKIHFSHETSTTAYIVLNAMPARGLVRSLHIFVALIRPYGAKS